MAASVAEVKARSETMGRRELEAAIAEAKGVIVHIQAQQEARGRSDGHWWQRAARVRADVTTKRRILGFALAARIPPTFSREERSALLRDARAEAAAGQVGTALVKVIDTLLRLWEDNP